MGQGLCFSKPLEKPHAAEGTRATQAPCPSLSHVEPSREQRGPTLEQSQNSLLTLLQEEEEQMFSSSREWLHLPLAEQGGGQGVLQG